MYDVKKSELEDSRNLESLGLGFTDHSYTFYETSLFLAVEPPHKDAALAFVFQIAEKAQIYQRTVYTFWDLLGDVGGLYGILQLIC